MKSQLKGKLGHLHLPMERTIVFVWTFVQKKALRIEVH